MDPSLISVGLEMAFCAASLVAATSPVLASMAPPVPLISYLVYCILGVSVVSTFSQDSKKQINIEKSIASLIDASELTTNVHPNDRYASQGGPLFALRGILRRSDLSTPAGGGFITTGSEGAFGPGRRHGRPEGRRRVKESGALSIWSYSYDQPNYGTDYEIMGRDAEVKRID